MTDTDIVAEARAWVDAYRDQYEGRPAVAFHFLVAVLAAIDQREAAAITSLQVMAANHSMIPTEVLNATEYGLQAIIRALARALATSLDGET